MNPDKQIIIDGLLERVNASPYVIVIDYTGLTVQQFSELRNRLDTAGARCTVAKNSYMRKVFADAGLPDISVGLVGQTAFVMGESEVFAAAKVIKNFAKEFKKPEMKIGVLGNAVLDGEKLKAIADIPSREAVLSQLLGTILEPASMIARVIKNKFDPDGDTSPSDDDSEATAESAPVAESAATAEATENPAPPAENVAE